jgi:WD40 repeat protein
MRTLNLGRGIFSAVGYTPDGRTLVSLNSRRHLRFWDLATFTERLNYTVADWRCGLNGRLSLGGSLMALDNTLFDTAPVLEKLKQAVTPGRQRAPLVPLPLADLPSDSSPSVRVTPGGIIVALGQSYLPGSPRHHRWEFAVHVYSQPDRRNATFPVDVWFQGFSLSPDGARLAGCGARHAIVYRLSDGKKLFTFEHTDTPKQTCHSPDGRVLAVAAGRTVWLWDLNDGRHLARFPAFRRHCVSLAFHPTAPLLAAGSREGEVRLYDTRALRETVRFDWDIGAVHGLAFAPDGTTAAAAGHNSRVVVWDVD